MATFRVVRENPTHQFKKGEVVTPLGKDTQEYAFFQTLAGLFGVTDVAAQAGAQPYQNQAGEVQVLEQSDVEEIGVGEGISQRTLH